MKGSGDSQADAATAGGSDWEFMLSPPGLETPGQLQQAAEPAWFPACVPGTVAQSLQAAGRWNVTSPDLLQQMDVWYRLSLQDQPAFDMTFEGLAGMTEIWLGETLLARHETMYRPVTISVPPIGIERTYLFLCVRTAQSWTHRRAGRARWRPRMIVPATLREVRQTLLGHMPGWCPDIPALGPYGPVKRRPAVVAPTARITRLTADWTPTGASLDLVLEWPHDAPPPEVHVAGQSLAARKDAPGTWVVQGAVHDALPWWPHTHGEPRLYELEVQAGSQRQVLAHIGFRRIEFDPTQSHRGLKVNGTPVFCRGVCWTPPDLAALWTQAPVYEAQVRRIADAGMNMVRVGGTMLYEHEAFYEACDRAGVLVWQDYMLANFDYPGRDPAFLAELEAEATHFLHRTACHPSLAVLCGGSEVRQQAEMLGSPWPTDDPIHEGVLRRVSQACRPDVSYVPNSPWGGPTAFSTRQGITHYYGVGAYMRPLEDARRAQVAFASECMALAHVPVESHLDAELASQPCNHVWKRGTPRDRGASWDFDDVRDHYVQRLYGVDPAQQRYEDVARYLDLGRAVSCDLAESLYSEWRRPASGCAGGLVWQLRDLYPGAGWGLWDVGAHPKPVWHALRRVLQPVQLLVTDEGLDGLDLHLVNETEKERVVELTLTCLRDGAKVVADGRCERVLAGHMACTVNSNELLGRFHDISHAYRFGPLAHDVAHAVMRDVRTGLVLGEAFHLPRRNLPRNDLGLSAEVTQDADGLWLTVSTRRFAQYVHFSCGTHDAQDDWFHLAPGVSRRVRLVPRTGATAQDPALAGGTLSALNALSSVWVKLAAST